MVPQSYSEFNSILRWVQFRGVAGEQEIWCRACRICIIPVRLAENWNASHFQSEEHRANVTMVKLAGESR